MKRLNKHSSKKTIKIQLYLEIYEQLKEYSKKTNKSISLIINECLNPLKIQRLSKRYNLPGFIIVNIILETLYDLKKQNFKEFQTFIDIFKNNICKKFVK
ncbi:MAG TPA: hypothetical protein ENG63_03475 [Candidatus Desulfofervidus auxilii]|uniref:Ribbon-helix-helix domain-containing protein n=1 Tax=Desulfofervidus auxilii TaxID=1621989 RepID=A0A7C0Y2D3_DESA2|nr:hypothetical protein [Candidatus Desulfofervidus auxilii]